MDFFDRQQQARRRTLYLGFLTILALGVVTVLLFLSVATIIEAVRLILPEPPEPRIRAWRDGRLLGWMAFYLLLITAGSMICRWLELRGGGPALAALFGGRLLHGAPERLEDRRLLNIVEEMAIAAGLPTPEVYVLEGQRGINAAAAGFSRHDAVILITRGAIDHLDRDELQGVVAHEFSHILNGDTRLNMRMMSLFNGLLAIHLIGAGMVRLVYNPDFPSVGLALARGLVSFVLGLIVLGLGAALLAVGYIGAMAARLIQAAMSRQREFLADAAAVQFTRNPDGLAGALRKIGGHRLHGVLADAHAEETSHMFIVEAVNYTISAFDSHPPLSSRLRRIDPSFDGTFRHPAPARRQTGSKRSTRPRGTPDRRRGRALAALQSSLTGLEGEQLAKGQLLLAQIPGDLREAIREPAGAHAVALFLLHWEGSPSCPYLETLQCDPAVTTELLRLLPDLRHISPSMVVPLAELLLPALHRLAEEQLRVFRAQVETTLGQNESSFSAHCLRRFLIEHLDRRLALSGESSSPAAALASLPEAISIVLATLAHAGGGDPNESFQAGQIALPSELRSTPILSKAAPPWPVLGPALACLSRRPERQKQIILRAAEFCVAKDGKVSEKEAHLLLMLAAALDLPTPPLIGIPGEEVASCQPFRGGKL